MDWLLILLIVSALAALLAWRFFFTRTSEFWHLAAKNPDLAIALFAMEQDCLVDIDPGSRRGDYLGPFRLKDKRGQPYKIYIIRTSVEEVQMRIASRLKSDAHR